MEGLFFAIGFLLGGVVGVLIMPYHSCDGTWNNY